MHLSDYACEYCRDDAMRGGTKMSQQIATACGHGSYATQGSMWCVQCGAERDECVLCGRSLSGQDAVQPPEEVEPQQEVANEPANEIVDAVSDVVAGQTDGASADHPLEEFEEALDDIAEDAFREREDVGREYTIDEVRELYPERPPDSTDGGVRWYHGGEQRDGHPDHQETIRQRFVRGLGFLKKRFWRKPQIEWKLAILALILAILLFIWTHSTV